MSQLEHGGTRGHEPPWNQGVGRAGGHWDEQCGGHEAQAGDVGV